MTYGYDDVNSHVSHPMRGRHRLGRQRCQRGAHSRSPLPAETDGFGECHKMGQCGFQVEYRLVGGALWGPKTYAAASIPVRGLVTSLAPTRSTGESGMSSELSIKQISARMSPDGTTYMRQRHKTGRRGLPEYRLHRRWLHSRRGLRRCAEPQLDHVTNRLADNLTG